MKTKGQALKTRAVRSMIEANAIVNDGLVEAICLAANIDKKEERKRAVSEIFDVRHKIEVSIKSLSVQLKRVNPEEKEIEKHEQRLDKLMTEMAALKEWTREEIEKEEQK